MDIYILQFHGTVPRCHFVWTLFQLHFQMNTVPNGTWLTVYPLDTTINNWTAKLGAREALLC